MAAAVFTSCVSVPDRRSGPAGTVCFRFRNLRSSLLDRQKLPNIFLGRLALCVCSADGPLYRGHTSRYVVDFFDGAGRLFLDGGKAFRCRNCIRISRSHRADNTSAPGFRDIFKLFPKDRPEAFADNHVGRNISVITVDDP